MAATVYRKTEAGRDEVATRRAGLSPQLRRVLIMVNGAEGAAAMAALGLPDLAQQLAALAEAGLIEPLPASSRSASSQPAAAVAAAPAPPVPAPVVEEDPRLQGLQRRAFLLLRQHFGPDTPIVGEAVFAARTIDDFHRALDGLEAKLAIYMGRKQALKELENLRLRG
ncbi:MAG: hypothetical protein JNK17_00035 [Hydrogenophaga sp.]|nr:hypothetical protein [Hydrogenophaga sp.]